MTDKSLLMIVPSRGRPDNVQRLLFACETVTRGDTQFLIAYDADDPAAARYRTMASYWFGNITFVENAQRRRIGPLLNTLTAQPRVASFFAVGFMGDDHLPRTKGWDQRFLDELSDLGTGIVYGNDLFQNENLPTAFAMSTDIIRALGYMVPGNLQHLYFDNAILELGKGIGRIRYLPDVVIEHLHPAAGKSEMDDSYRDTNSSTQYIADGACFERYKATGLQADIDKLKELIACG